MGLDFERLDVPLEATRDRLEDLIMLRVRERGVVASQRVNVVNLVAFSDNSTMHSTRPSTHSPSAPPAPFAST